MLKIYYQFSLKKENEKSVHAVFLQQNQSFLSSKSRSQAFRKLVYPVEMWDSALLRLLWAALFMCFSSCRTLV